MRYTVVWSPDAQDQLVELWLTSDDRNAITRATHAIDQALQQDPILKGDDFYGDRILVKSPLQVIFRVRADDMLVEVITIW